MDVVLIGNYPPSGQQSMLRFAACLESELRRRQIQVELIAPQPKATRYLPFRGAVRKWLGYVDQFIFFPRNLRRRQRALPQNTIVHICDHSNAMYQRHLRNHKSLVTCHDLLAVRGAAGDQEAYCEVSSTGKVLQRWIRNSLESAPNVVCDSQATAADFRRLLPKYDGGLSVLPLGLNSPYVPIAPEEAFRRIARFTLERSSPFVLMVGSNHVRKNREGALRIIQKVGSRFSGSLVLAGQSLTPVQKALARALGIESRIIELGPVTNSELEALYSTAHALLFPSKAEGFGWPVLEAQACGCPVVCSDRTSIPEVAGDGAFVHDLADEAGFADSIVRLLDPTVRADLRKRGFQNAATMTTERMVDDYVALYRDILGIAER